MQNEFLVGLMGADVVIQLPKPRMTKAEALNLAARIVAVADPLGDEWQQVLEEVLES